MSADRRRSYRASVVLVDIGNTRIKWAIWRAGRLAPMRAAFHQGWAQKDYERHLFGGGSETGPMPLGRRVSAIVVASVAGARVNRLLTAAARHACGVRPRFIATSRRAAGVTTRYIETWRLGVDRFIGVIGARSLLGAAGVCVVNAGTAVTIDLLDAQGVHRGGAILPGPRLMVASLLEGTAGIGRRARGKADPQQRSHRAALFARSTRAAIEGGARYAAASAVDRAVTEARRVLGKTPRVLLTGGGADELEPLIRARHVRVADLVLRGIAAHVGLALAATRRPARRRDDGAGSPA